MPRYLRIISLLENPCDLCLYVSSIFVLIFRCWTAAFTASCQQGGGHSHTFYAHILCYFYVFSLFSSHTPLPFERKSRQKRFSYSATREAAKWGSVKTVPGSRFSCNRRVFLGRPLWTAASFSLKHVQPFPINGCTGGSYRRLMCLYMRNGSCQ